MSIQLRPPLADYARITGADGVRARHEGPSGMIRLAEICAAPSVMPLVSIEDANHFMLPSHPSGSRLSSPTK
jgi:hypothetical protein